MLAIKGLSIHDKEVACFSGEAMVLLRCLFSLGIAVSPTIGFSRHLGFMRFAVSRPIPPSFTLAIIPEEAVWKVNGLHDRDINGLLPSPTECLECLPKNHNTMDVFYLALFLSLNACSERETWPKLASEQLCMPPLNEEIRALASAFLRSLSMISPTPPLELFLLMVNYSLHASIRLPDKRNPPINYRSSLSLVPLVDIALMDSLDETNVVLSTSDTKGVSAKLRDSPLKNVNRCIKNTGKDSTFWLLQTIKSVPKGHPLKLTGV